jgi:hypothetical protein
MRNASQIFSKPANEVGELSGRMPKLDVNAGQSLPTN